MTEEQDNTGEEQELYEHFRIVADKGQEPLRVDKFLMNRIENATRTKIQQAATAGNVLVNEKQIKPNYKVKPGDIVTVVFAHPPREIELIPEDIPLEILHEDDDLILLNKQAGLVVHPGYGNYKGTLVNALVYHFKNLPNNPSSEEPRPGLVHRLDKNTSGVMVVAKNEMAMTRLAKLFFDRDLDRSYVALVWGDVKEEEGVIEGNIGRSLKNRKVMHVFPDGDFGKHAVTRYKVLERFGYVTLVECKLETGRTHQIRVHMKYLGHPLFNDETYGGDKILKGTSYTKYKQFVDNCFKLLPRHALHAKSLGFKHPTSGEAIFHETPMPEDMTAAVEKWRKYVANRKEED